MILSTHTCSNLLIPPQIFSHSNFFDPSIIWTQTFFLPNFAGTQNYFETKFLLLLSYNKKMANIADFHLWDPKAWFGLSALALSY